MIRQQRQGLWRRGRHNERRERAGHGSVHALDVPLIINPPDLPDGKVCPHVQPGGKPPRNRRHARDAYESIERLREFGHYVANREILCAMVEASRRIHAARRTPPADAPRFFINCDLDARGAQIAGAREPRDPGPDDCCGRDAWHASTLLKTTRTQTAILPAALF
jgi:hypothetical protein